MNYNTFLESIRKYLNEHELSFVCRFIDNVKKNISNDQILLLDCNFNHEIVKNIFNYIDNYLCISDLENLYIDSNYNNNILVILKGSDLIKNYNLIETTNIECYNNIIVISDAIKDFQKYMIFSEPYKLIKLIDNEYIKKENDNIINYFNTNIYREIALKVRENNIKKFIDLLTLNILKNIEISANKGLLYFNTILKNNIFMSNNLNILDIVKYYENYGSFIEDTIYKVKLNDHFKNENFFIELILSDDIIQINGTF